MEDFPVIKISPEDIESGRHDLAECASRMSDDCFNLVKYKQTVVEHVEGQNFLNTAYYCEDHKPE